MGFMISTWFTSANTTSAMGAILIFIFYLPYGFLNQNDQTPAGVRAFFCLLSPVDMSYGCSLIASWEARGEGKVMK